MWKIILYSKCGTKFLIFAALSLISLITVGEASDGCGGFVELNSGGTFTFATRNNYGYSTYEAYSNCIWLIEAKDNNLVSLTIASFEGQEEGGECRDYIFVTDGSLSANVLLDKNCSTLTNVKINSTARWMLFQFRSDGANFTSGFSASVTATRSPNDLSGYATPIADCDTHHYKCSNKMCLPRSYICDGFNDCGCTDDCDESGCSGIGLTSTEIIGIGVAIGAFIFIIIFIVVHVIERRRKKKALMEEEETERQIRKNKKGGSSGKDKDSKDKKDSKGKNGKVAPKQEKESESNVHWV